MKNLKIFTLLILSSGIISLNAHEHRHEHKHNAHAHEHKHKSEAHHDHDHHDAKCGALTHDAQTEVVEVGEKALKSMGLSTVHPQKRRMKSTMPLIGRMELSSDAKKDAPSPVAGRLSIKVNELDRVKKGDILFSIDSPQIKAISHEIKILQSRLDVYRKLKTTNAEIAANLKVKTAEKKALLAGAEEKDGVVTVRATTEAMVEKLNTPDGAWVETGNAVISLVRTKALRFRSLAVSSEAAKLHDGMRAIVGGVDATIKLGIGEATGITPVFAVFDEKTIPPGRAGERIKGECILNENEKETLAIPDECIINIGAEPTVFVSSPHKKGVFFAVKIQTGLSCNGFTEVKGLPNFEHLDIVKDGVYALKLQLSLKSQEKPIGHFHADGTFHDGEH